MNTCPYCGAPLTLDGRRGATLKRGRKFICPIALREWWDKEKKAWRNPLPANPIHEAIRVFREDELHQPTVWNMDERGL